MMWLQQKCHEKVIRVTAIPTSINSADIGTKALAAHARMRGLMFMTGMVDDDNRVLGKDEFRDIERKMLDKGAKKILSGLKDEYRMALVMAFANVIRASGTKVEEIDPNGAESDSWMWPVLAILASIGALSLVQWLWSFFIKKIQKEIIISGKATFQEANDSEPEVSARSDIRKRASPVRMLHTGNVYHTHETRVGDKCTSVSNAFHSLVVPWRSTP